MIWAQVTPFVALALYKEEDKRANKEDIFSFLLCCVGAWLIMNVFFFCSIDLSYINTFFGVKTASQYTIERFTSSDSDAAKFEAVFWNRISYTESIREEVKTWVSNNIDRWRDQKVSLDWFDIDAIPNDYLPQRVLIQEGGSDRRRPSFVLELVGLGDSGKVHVVESKESN